MITNIDQAAALAGNVTPGDAPGFPVRLSVPGSYQLQSNLEVPATVAHAIEITASHVTLNLNGFLIFKKKPEFTPAIIGSAERVNFVKILNGHIHGMGGVQLGGIGNRVEGLQIDGTDSSLAPGITLGDLGMAICNQVSGAVTGAHVGKNGLVKDNVFRTGHGVAAGDDSIVERNTTDGAAAQSAFQVGNRAIVTKNVVGKNDGGLQCGSLCVIKDNVVHDNQAFGVAVGDGSVVTGNVVNKISQGPGIGGGAGLMVGGNSITGCGEGVNVPDSCLIDANAVSNCIGFGLNMQKLSGYAVNVLTNNNGGGVQVSGGFQVDKNECNGAFCP